MKNFKIAGFLAAVLLSLGLLAQWDEWQTKKDEEKKSAETQLVKMDPSAVTAIEYFNAGDEAAGEKTVEVVLSKVDGTWRISKPVQTIADQQAIENLLTTLKDYKFDKIVGDTKAEWKNFGLDSPRRRISLSTAEGSKTIFVGSNATIGYHVYSATSDSDRVVIGSQYLAVSLSKTLHELRDKSLVKVDDKSIKTFEWATKGSERITMNLNDKNSFEIVSDGQTLAADSVEIRNTIDELNRMQVAEFIDLPDQKLVSAFDDGQRFLEVTFKMADGSATSLRFSEFEGKLVASRGEGAVFRLSPEAKSKLTKSLKDFRNRKIFNFESDDLASVELDGKTWAAVAGDWYSSEDAAKFSTDGKFPGKESDKPQPASEIRALLVDLEFARAEEIMPVKDPRFQTTLQGAPKHKLKLTYKAELARAPILIDVWNQNSGDWVLKNSEAPDNVYGIKPTLFDALNPSRPNPMESSGDPSGDEAAALLESIGDMDQSGLSN
jgi:hypothetical protein